MAAFAKRSRHLSSGALDTRTTGPAGHRIVDDPFSIISLLVPNSTVVDLQLQAMCQILAKC